MYDYSIVNKENIMKLIVGLPNCKELDMSGFADDYLAAAKSSPENICGTSACVIGFAPSCGIPVPDKFIDIESGRVNWAEFSGLIIDSPLEDGNIKLWRFAFSAEWSNSKEEAIARLKLIHSESVPEKWDYEDKFCEVEA